MRFFPIDFDTLSYITDRVEFRAANKEYRDINECIRDLNLQILCKQYDSPEELEAIHAEIRDLRAYREKLWNLIRKAVILE